MRQRGALGKTSRPARVLYLSDVMGRSALLPPRPLSIRNTLSQRENLRIRDQPRRGLAADQDDSLQPEETSAPDRLVNRISQELQFRQQAIDGIEVGVA